MLRNVEILVSLGLIVFLLAVSFGGALGFWSSLLIFALYLGLRAYRIRCARCGEGVIKGRGMRFCNQCGVEQTGRGIHFRCSSCRRLTRSELNLNFCNGCGASVDGSG